MSENDQPSSARIPNRDRLLQKRGLPDLPDARRRMVEYLRTNGYGSEPVLEAMMEIPRHAFASPPLWRMAYADTELWGPTAFLPQPRVVAKIATALQDSNAKKVLEYATGTGYLTSVMAVLAEEVYTVEHDPWQLWLSSDAFRELELTNISQKVSDGRLGWPERAPYDGVVVAAAVPRVLQSLLAQLTDTGVFIAPIGSYYGPHRLVKAQKTAQGTTVEDLGPCFFPPLLGVWTPMDIALGASMAIADPPAPGIGFWGAGGEAAAPATGSIEGVTSPETEGGSASLEG